MPTPVVELIAEEVVDRLEEITTGNGYSLTATTVRPARLSAEDQWRDKTIVVVQGPSVRVPDLDCPGNPPAQAFAVTFNLYCIRRDADRSTTARMTAANEIAACCQKAITAGTNWHMMGGNAIDTGLGTITPITSPNGDMTVVHLPFRVTYRVSENDPYTVRG